MGNKDHPMTNRYISELNSIFEHTSDKREAHRRSRQVLQDMSGDSHVFTEALERHVTNPENLRTLHYPVLAVDVEVNPHYHLVANCWIPLPGRQTDVSTKAVHHHGSMLLTSVTAFGPGYDHWIFTLPEQLETDNEYYSTRLLERGPHPRHHLAFVDSYIAHLPFYPASLTVTYALWSSHDRTSWKDKLKRIPWLQKRSNKLRKAAARLGLAGALDLKIAEKFDFYPTEKGLRVIPERIEFARGPNEDYLYSLFHILQVTGNAQLATLVEEHLQAERITTNRQIVAELLAQLESGRPIEGRLSPGHYDVPHANFTVHELQRALAVGGP
jgi:hypothetical protein